MAKYLVIVESPAKAKTIEKFLGADYKVTSSYGHIRDLAKKGFGIDIEHRYEPEYEISADKKKLVTDLKKAAKEAAAKKKAEEEAKKKAEEEAKKKAEAEAKKKAEEEAKKKAEAEAKKKAEEARRRADSLEQDILGTADGTGTQASGQGEAAGYGAKVQQLIEQNWRIDPSMNNKKVVVSINVDDQGRISSPQCRGDQRVCRTALETLERIGMLPRPPKGCSDCRRIVITMIPRL